MVGNGLHTADQLARTELVRVAADLGWHLHAVAETRSTMELAKTDAGQHPEAQFGLAIADEQSAGRGRRGNDWLSPRGGFYCTFWWRTQLTPGELSGLSLAIGVMVAECLEQCSAKVGLKWPNDLIDADFNKVGGILIETVASRPMVVLCGIGLNLSPLSQAHQQALKPGSLQSGSLEEIAGQRVHAHRLAQLMIDKLTLDIPKFAALRFEAWRKPFTERMVWLNETVELLINDSPNVGIVRGVAKDGQLLLEQNGVVHSVASAEIQKVRLCRSP